MAIATSLQHVASLLEKLSKEWQAGNGALIAPLLCELFDFSEEQLHKGAQALASNFGGDEQNLHTGGGQMISNAFDEAEVFVDAETAAAPSQIDQAEDDEDGEEDEEEEEVEEEEKDEDVSASVGHSKEVTDVHDAVESSEESSDNEKQEETENVFAAVVCTSEDVTEQQDAAESSEESSEEEEEEEESAAQGELEHDQEVSEDADYEKVEHSNTPDIPVQPESTPEAENGEGRNANPEAIRQLTSPLNNQVEEVQTGLQESEDAVNKASAASGGRLRLLSNSQKNSHKLCKKKMKEIELLGAQIDSKKLKYKDLSAEQKAKLDRRAELSQTIAELEALADELIEKEKAEEEAARAAEAARKAEEELRRLMETPEWKAQNAARLAEEARRAKEEAERRAAAEARRAEEEARRAAEEATRRAEEEAAAARRAKEEAAAKKKAEEAKKKAEEEAKRLAEQRAAEERERQQKLRKTSTKKLKEIYMLKEKIKSNGQALSDLLPEVQEKIAKQVELEALVAELDGILGPA